ncbi:Fluoroquinolones export permease protein [Paenibacillus sp. CECT 9249]|uniref:fluoroquinolone export ABC transporter permease subunit n=1 Tax=Paenibacillus sp. CECT 9249 TaxID=2845385 RepID=UPI001E4E6D41|nr:ABC transporter permease [Paenibacillus sp. CECT 9249]CAH0119327.1 Fluoroquinolones export permease protein [Paenibacillus sp. CECT 9249]
MRLASAFVYDMKLQFRHGFYYAYLFISAAYIVLLRLMPREYKETASILITFSDPSVLGFFFIGGLVLLEKGQNVYDNLFVTPYRPAEYIVSKTLSLTLLSVVTSYAVHVGAFGFHTNLLLYVTGVALTSFFFTLIGMGLAVRCQTLNGFFFMSTLYTFVFVLPLFETVDVWTSPLFAVLPAKASLLLLGTAFSPLDWRELAYGLLLLAGWNAIAFLWTWHSFRKFIILKIGNERRGGK